VGFEAVLGGGIALVDEAQRGTAVEGFANVPAKPAVGNFEALTSRADLVQLAVATRTGLVTGLDNISIRGSGRLRFYKLRDLGMGCKPDITLGLGVTDDLVQYPDA
jgi:hypothetical protein